MQVPQYYNDIPQKFLGKKTKQPTKKTKRKKRKRGRKKKSANDNQGLGQYYKNQSQAQAWAITTNTIPGLLTKQKNLNFENRILTNTIPRNRGEIENTRKFVDQLAWSQQRINTINKRMLIDPDDPVRRNLNRAFDQVAYHQNPIGPPLPPGGFGALPVAPPVAPPLIGGGPPVAPAG